MCASYLVYVAIAKSVLACCKKLVFILLHIAVVFISIQIKAFPGEMIKLVILSFDEQNYPTSDTIQILDRKNEVSVKLELHDSCLPFFEWFSTVYSNSVVVALFDRVFP